MEDLLLAWPDQLLELQSLDPLRQAAAALRLSDWSKAEALLLAIEAGRFGIGDQQVQAVQLLVYLRLLQERNQEAVALLQRIAPEAKGSAFCRWLQLQCCLNDESDLALAPIPESFWNASADSLLMQLARIAVALRLGDLVGAEQLLERFPLPDCLEFMRLRARLLQAQGKLQQAYDFLTGAFQRFPQHRALARHYTVLAIEAKARTQVVPALRQALSNHGEVAELLPQVTQVKLLQRQPGLARRSACLDRLWVSVQPRATPTNRSNHLNCYEQCGNAEWFNHLHPSVFTVHAAELDLLANLNLQLASLESPAGEQLTQQFIASLNQAPLFQQLCAADPQPRKGVNTGGRLRIAWISGDVCEHPVARFLLSFLEASTGQRQHQHLLVSTQAHGPESLEAVFAALPDLEVVDISKYPPDQRFAAVRALQPHITIDLSGWTGGNFLTGFIARLAPLQITYLGYFASTGVPAMDVWLGDAQLFPETMQEWHTEAIHRLARCFIAWQPSQHFPEASIDVASAPSGGIRFGSFNHTRKFSDACLRLWGQLLESIPDSSLVLKANASGDTSTQELLRRRMLRAGLNPERVHWLPFMATSRDHLHQYAQIDIALDCFPNGGCTTSCEALWMGVPVITLTGRSYVSRMSTAVLHGAGLPEWCAASPQAYLDLAIAQAEQLTHLRQSRDHWRRQVQTNPLGDAADLMQHLEGAFSALYQQRCAALAASR